MAVFDRGDIVRVSLDPAVGHEMRGESRPALVLTTKEFNQLGDVLVAPITQGGDYTRFAGFAVSLTGSLMPKPLAGFWPGTSVPVT